ncbi:MAG TPA: hypothetical protein VK571_00980 [Gemmatimonadaceae bacterium]|nr:hypothetical protein [Gemmatimonadaceae bacterium]
MNALVLPDVDMDANVVRNLRGMPDRRLSRMLDIVRAQIPLAIRLKDDATLARLQHHETVIIAARVAKFPERKS